MGRLHFSDQKEENNLADKNLKARIVNKNGTSAGWEKATSFVPKKGELILYTDLNKIKIGDGVTKVNDLPFSNDDKVSKAGDTMTGFLALKGTEPYPGAGVILLGNTLDNGFSNPSILGGVAGGSTQIVVSSDTTLFGPIVDETSELQAVFSPTEIRTYKPIKACNADNEVMGSLSDTTDGVALSAENGACLKVGAQAVTVCDNAGSTSQIKGVKAPVNDTDAANKKYVDDAIPTAQIKELSSAIAKAEPFIVEVTMTNPSNISANKTFAEIKTASDAGKLCYARITNSGIMMPLIAFDLRVDKRVAVFSSSNLLISTFQTISLLIAEDNSVSTESFNSQSQIEATGLLKGSGNGTIIAAVAGTDYAAVNHTHDTYTATEIDAMWNAVTIS